MAKYMSQVPPSPKPMPKRVGQQMPKPKTMPKRVGQKPPAPTPKPKKVKQGKKDAMGTMGSTPEQAQQRKAQALADMRKRMMLRKKQG